MIITHYIPPFTETRGRGIHQMQRAFCGAWVEEAQHSAEPSCERCQEFLEADAKQLALLMGMGPCTNPVSVQHIDIHAGYRPRTR